jgi:hypothetical protein
MNLSEATTEEIIAELTARLRTHCETLRCGTVTYRKSGPAAGAEITAVVAREFGVSEGMIMGRLRSKRVARARQVAMSGMWLAGYSYPDVGRFFGRDHGTVMHAVKRTGADKMKPTP